MNIYDIAKASGVSIATVSRVINNKGNVSKKTREKIEAVMAKSDYQPSAIARGLASGSTKTIAIFSVDVRVPHHATTSYTMEQLLANQGYMVVICNTGEEIENWRRYLTLIRERNIDGIILTGSIYNGLEHEEILNSFTDIPIVMANGRMNLPNVRSVFVDEGRGIELAVDHMFSRNHTKLAYVVDKTTESAERKKNGFIRGMILHGEQDPGRHVYYTSYGLEAGADIALKLFEKGYEGIVFGEDLTAVGAMNALSEKGIRVPEQMAVTGCNNSEYAYICRPGLTSINNKAEILSEMTVRLLVDLIDGKKETAEMIIIPELVVRGST
jgi:LacI family transcriptional regulator